MRKVLAVIIIFSPIMQVFSIGNFQIGFFTGITPDLNNISKSLVVDSGDSSTGTQILNERARRDSIEYYDNLIEDAIKNRSATGSSVGYPIALSAGFDLRYMWNLLFLRLQFDYSKLVFNKSGKLKTTTYDDSINYFSDAITMPLSIGFSQSLNDYFHFYFGFGPYYSYSQVKVTHSDPKAFTETALAYSASSIAAQPNLLPHKRAAIKANVLGWQIFLGVQVPIVKNKYYISIDYMHFEGRSVATRVQGQDYNGNEIVDSRGDTIIQNFDKYLIGLQYYISL